MKHFIYETTHVNVHDCSTAMVTRRDPLILVNEDGVEWPAEHEDWLDVDDEDFYVISAEALEVGMRVDAEPLYRAYGIKIPEWAKFECVELTEVKKDEEHDWAILSGDAFEFALPYQRAVIVARD